jgi:uncharacterized protein YcnI
MRVPLLRAALLGAVWLLVLASPVSAHVLVWPSESPAGASQRYGIVVPGEKAVPTVRLEVQFPRLLRVEALETRPGWRVSMQRDSGGRIIAATWEGEAVGADQFVEFGVLAQNPDQPAQLTWTMIQTYADASEVQWNAPSGSEFPAPVTRISSPVFSFGLAEVLAGGALLVALVALYTATVQRSRAASGRVGVEVRELR